MRNCDIDNYVEQLIETETINDGLKPHCVNGIKLLHSLAPSVEIEFDSNEIRFPFKYDMEVVDIKLLVAMNWMFEEGYWIYSNE